MLISVTIIIEVIRTHQGRSSDHSTVMPFVWAQVRYGRGWGRGVYMAEGGGAGRFEGEWVGVYEGENEIMED